MGSIVITGGGRRRGSGGGQLSGFSVDYPQSITYGNDIPQYITPRFTPAAAASGVLYITQGSSVTVNDMGKIMVVEPGITTVYVIPINGAAYYKRIEISVVTPVMRLTSADSLRLNTSSALRLI